MEKSKYTQCTWNGEINIGLMSVQPKSSIDSIQSLSRQQ